MEARVNFTHRSYIRGSSVYHLPVNLRSTAPTGLAWCGHQGRREVADVSWALHLGICQRCQAKAPAWWTTLREGQP